MAVLIAIRGAARARRVIAAVGIAIVVGITAIQVGMAVTADDEKAARAVVREAASEAKRDQKSVAGLESKVAALDVDEAAAKRRLETAKKAVEDAGGKPAKKGILGFFGSDPAADVAAAEKRIAGIVAERGVLAQKLTAARQSAASSSAALDTVTAKAEAISSELTRAADERKARQEERRAAFAAFEAASAKHDAALTEASSLAMKVKTVQARIKDLEQEEVAARADVMAKTRMAGRVSGDDRFAAVKAMRDAENHAAGVSHELDHRRNEIGGITQAAELAQQDLTAVQAEYRKAQVAYEPYAAAERQRLAAQAADAQRKEAAAKAAAAQREARAQERREAKQRKADETERKAVADKEAKAAKAAAAAEAKAAAAAKAAADKQVADARRKAERAAKIEADRKADAERDRQAAAAKNAKDAASGKTESTDRTDTSSAAAATTSQQRAEITAEKYEYSVDGKVMTGIGDVKATYQDITVLAEKIVYNIETHDFTASGNVRLKQLKNTWRSEKVIGNIKAKSFDFGEYESTFEPWYVQGVNVNRTPDGKTHFENGKVSTCEHLLGHGAHWHMSAKRIVYDDAGRFTAYDVTYKLGDFPVFYLPMAWGQTDWEKGGYEFSPGYDSDFGATLRIGKRWEVNDAVSTRMRLHLMSKRGVGLENDTDIVTDRSTTHFHGFGLADSDPPSDTMVGGEEFNGRFAVEDNRYRLALSNRTDFSDQLTLRLQSNYLSDNDLMWEFYEDEFRVNPEAATFIDLRYQSERFEMSLHSRPSINDFETVVERLPEYRLDMHRQQIAGLPLYYEGRNSMARLRMNWREYDTPRTGAGLTDPDNYEATRVDTLHSVYAPFKLWDISFVPRASARWTWYSDTSLTPVTDAELNSTFKADSIRATIGDTNPTSSYDELGGDQGRFAWEVGMEMSTKFYRTNPNFKSDFLSAEGFRHILKPYINYTYLPEPTLEREFIYFFDDVDRLQQTHFVRVGIDNRFQTRRKRRIHTFARMENYIDFNLNTDTEGDAESADFGTVVELAPTEKWKSWVKVLIDTDEGELSAVNAGFRFGAVDEPNFSIAYLFRDDYVQSEPYSMATDFTRIVDSTIFPTAYDKNHNIRLRLNLPINEKTQFIAEQYYDLEEDELARQRYELVRDLHCWVAALQLDKDRDDFSVMLSFYLKAFPGTKIKAGL